MPDAESNGPMYDIVLHRSQTWLNALVTKTESRPAWPGERYKTMGHYTRTRDCGLANPPLGPPVVA